MSESVEAVARWWMTGALGLLLYWLPLVWCLLGYTQRTANDVSRDVVERDLKPKFYYPRITVGTVVGRLLVSVVPVANLVALVCDLGPKALMRTIDWFGRVLDFPLVPVRKSSAEEKRE